MTPVIDHINITVRDIKLAEAFYDKLMPILGFDLVNKSSGRVEANDFSVVEYIHPSFTFAINSPREKFKDVEIHRRKPGALHHLAFRANSEDEVKSLYEQVNKIGANMVSEARLFPEYGLHYYAFYFKDLEGIKYEIMYEK